MTLSEARKQIGNRNIFGSMMLHMGDADALVSGVTQHFPDTIRPALEIVRVREGLHKVSGCYAMITRKGDIYFLADTSVNIEPTAEDLVEIALCTAQTARRFDVEPRVALLSFSSFGSTKHPQCEKVRRAVELLHRADPTLMVDGELMADDAVSTELEHSTVQPAEGRGQCADLPRSQFGQHRLQAAVENRRRRDPGPDPDGHEQAGSPVVARCRSRGNCERDGDRRG